MTFDRKDIVDVARTETVSAVTTLIANTLDLADPESLDERTGLFGSMPELDSLAIVQLVTELEDHFGFEFDEDDITGEVFENVGSLSDYVDRQSTG